MNRVRAIYSCMPFSGEKPIHPLNRGGGQGEGEHSARCSESAFHNHPKPSRFFFGFFLVLLSAAFLKPLVALVRLSTSESLFSHLLLIPLISAYLIWLKRNALKLSPKHRSSWLPALLSGTIGVAALFFAFFASPAWKAEGANYTFVFIFAYVCFVWTLSLAVFGWQTIRQILFPVAFLIFMVPFPTAVTHGIEAFFQYTSAEMAALLFGLSQTPVLRDGPLFSLPGITLEVAQECSGIRSSLVLFITSLVAGYMFFELKRYRAILALAVIPIAIVRNGLRILTIGLLCVHFGPEMIHSLIHRKGGPLFFALSLIPFGALLVFLFRRERKLRQLQPRGPVPAAR